MIFANIYSRVFFSVFSVGLLCAFAAFGRNLLHRDSEYENFMPWSLRLLIYGLGYGILPVVGIAVGVYMLTRASRVRHKFGKGSLFISAVYSCLYASSYFGLALR
jgi:TctA family transporter